MTGGISAGRQRRVPRKGAAKKWETLVAAFIGIALMLSFTVACSKDSGGSSSSSTSQGEVLLTAATEQGPDPLTTAPMASAPNPQLAQPVTEPNVTIDVPKPPQPKQTSGGGPGLYGGTNDNAKCDPKGIVDFLAAHSDKAKAWVDALNKDPDVKLPNGQPLTVQTIPEYIGSLTSLVLTTDTRVTNHGFVNAPPVANPFQAVLQKGTAVLVDNKGVPRTRCLCGNPLLPPQAVSGKVVYKGNRWADFNLTQIYYIIKVDVALKVFMVVQCSNWGKPCNCPLVPNRITITTYGPPPTSTGSGSEAPSGEVTESTGSVETPDTPADDTGTSAVPPAAGNGPPPADKRCQSENYDNCNDDGSARSGGGGDTGGNQGNGNAPAGDPGTAPKANICDSYPSMCENGKVIEHQ